MLGVVEVRGTALWIAAIFSLETGSGSKADKEEKWKWRAKEKKHWERAV